MGSQRIMIIAFWSKRRAAASAAAFDAAKAYVTASTICMLNLGQGCCP